MTKFVEDFCRASRQVKRGHIFGELGWVVPREFLHTGTALWSRDVEGRSAMVERRHLLGKVKRESCTLQRDEGRRNWAQRV
jgi:hypothetical protein